MCTVTRSVKWRLGNWATCFLPLDDEAALSPQAAVKNMAFQEKEGITRNKLPRPSRKRQQRRHINTHLEKDKDGISIRNRNQDSSYQLSADEDYIVFCFREDGAFHVVKDGKTTVRSQILNRKLIYGEDAQRFNKRNTQEKRSNENQHDQDCINLPNEDEEKEMIIYIKNEPRDSDFSEGSSTSSFAFPALGWEWIGSPVKMPGSESLVQQQMEQKGLSSGASSFQCCRF